VPGLRKLIFVASLLRNFTHHNWCIVKVNFPAETSRPSKLKRKIANLTSVVKKEEGSLVENLAGAEVPRAQKTCATALGSHQDRLVNRLFTFPRRSQLDTTISLPAKLVLLDYHLRVKKHCERHNEPKLCAFAKETDQI